MKARHLCAVLGIAIAVGAVVFMQSLVATNDHQATAVAERLLKELPVETDATLARLALDYRPDGRVMQGPPMMALLATQKGVDGVVVTKALFAQRKLSVPEVGTEMTLVGRNGAYRLPITGVLDWDRPLGRGSAYPNAFVSPETAATIGEDWRAFERPTAEVLAPAFMSDAGRNFDRAKALLLWAAALTALCLLMNSLFLTVEAQRRDIAVLRMLGLTRGGIVRRVLREALVLSAAGFAVGVAGALGALMLYVAADAALFPLGAACSRSAIVLAAVLTPVLAVLATLLALRPALAVRPLEAASARQPRKRPLGMLLSFAFGFGAFVAVEVWGTSLTSVFVPSAEWPDAIVSILPGGVSSFDIEKLGKLEGVKKIAELQPLQVNLMPLEELSDPRGGAAETDKGKDAARPGRPPMKSYRNALLLASDWLPEFRFSAGDHTTAAAALTTGDTCVVTEMMARAHGWKLGDAVQLDCGRGLEMTLKIVGIVDLNWHLVTSRALVRGMNRMPVNTDGPLFVSFDTLAACDMRPQHIVAMTHLWLDYTPEFLAAHGVFEAGRRVEKAIVAALNGADLVTEEGDVRGNTVRLHSRDEVSEGTLAHGNDLVGSMARVPFIFIGVISLGFIAMLVGSVDSRRRAFAVMRTVGATQGDLAKELVREALGVAAKGIAFGLVGGAAVGWLFTFSTRKLMPNWGLPPAFSVPYLTLAEGAACALLVALAVALPTALILIRRACRR